MAQHTAQSVTKNVQVQELKLIGCHDMHQNLRDTNPSRCMVAV